MSSKPLATATLANLAVRVVLVVSGVMLSVLFETTSGSSLCDGRYLVLFWKLHIRMNVKNSRNAPDVLCRRTTVAIARVHAGVLSLLKKKELNGCMLVSSNVKLEEIWLFEV